MIIKNDFLTVEIANKGAEIQSIKDKEGNEYIWTGDPEVWASRTPITFPICGGLKEDKFIYLGKEYILGKHGYVKKLDFELESSTSDSSVFLHKSNEETKKSYPFDYEFRAKYSLCGNTVCVIYETTNKTDGEMYMSVGGHEGYLCPEGIEEYSVVFEKKETLNSYTLYGNLLGHDYTCLGENTDRLKLKYEYFAIDALVFKDLKSRKATLINDKTGRKIELDFADSPYFVIWTKPGAKYVCLEPWNGVQDPIDSNMDITQKEGIVKLAKGEIHTSIHKISIN